MSAERVPLWLYGASGMLAGECLRLAEGHPRLVVAGAISREGGRALRELHTHLSNEVVTQAEDSGLAALARDAAAGPTALVLGMPHGISGGTFGRLAARVTELGGESAARNLFVVDLAADFRLRDSALYERAYRGAHPDPETLESFIYGLPELLEVPRGARRIAAPGCFATALQLACVPAFSAGLLDLESPWHLFGVTGSSGSGVEPKATTHHPYRSGNFWAYGHGGHRHEAELEQAIVTRGGSAPPIRFVPHSGPFVRGIHLTAALPLARPVQPDEARATYAAAFEGRPFVEVLEAGVPDLHRVVGSNRAVLAVHLREQVLHVMLCLDNLIKGGSGQALQALNLALGWPEDTGLARAGLGAS